MNKIILITLLAISFLNSGETEDFLNKIAEQNNQNYLERIEQIAKIYKEPFPQDYEEHKLSIGKKVLTIFYMFSMGVNDVSLESFMDQSGMIYNKDKNIKFYGVLRGFPKENIIKYFDKLHETKREHFVLKVHPEIYSVAKLKKVPAFMVSFCPTDFKFKECDNEYLVKGDITLRHALEVIKEKDATFEKILEYIQ